MMARILTQITPPCHEVTRMISQALDSRLPLRKRFAIRLHRLMCLGCDRYFHQLQVMRDASRNFPRHLDEVSAETLVPDKKSSIKQAMRHERK